MVLAVLNFLSSSMFTSVVTLSCMVRLFHLIGAVARMEVHNSRFSNSAFLQITRVDK